jgi:energy-coupling factor transporter ATP-binding protein EcfA2
VTLALAGARYRYAGTPRDVLDGVDLTVEPGRVVGLVGANESGKSTVCLVASGLAPASIGGRLEGSVTMDGVETRSLKPHELAQRCGVLFQNPTTQLSGTAVTVFEELAFGPRNLGLEIGEVVARVEWALETLGIGALAPKDPARLSGGQAQLVALASVLALRPAYLVLDEPTSQLDPQGTRLVGEALTRLAGETNTGILIAEHKTELLAAMAQRVVVLDAGRVTASGQAAEVLDDVRLPELGVEPPAAVRLGRALAEAGVAIEPGMLAAVASGGPREPSVGPRETGLNEAGLQDVSSRPPGVFDRSGAGDGRA